MPDESKPDEGYPYPENPWQTHWEGCWQAPRHHNCAVWYVRSLEARIEALEARLAVRQDVAVGPTEGA
jgi:hypothetical protein